MFASYLDQFGVIVAADGQARGFRLVSQTLACSTSHFQNIFTSGIIYGGSVEAIDTASRVNLMTGLSVAWE